MDDSGSRYFMNIYLCILFCFIYFLLRIDPRPGTGARLSGPTRLCIPCCACRTPVEKNVSRQFFVIPAECYPRRDANKKRPPRSLPEDVALYTRVFVTEYFIIAEEKSFSRLAAFTSRYTFLFTVRCCKHVFVRRA